MYTVHLPSGSTFTADIGQSLIEAAASSGITLPYSCQNGRCSTCKCRLTGPTEVLFEELGLSLDEKKEGWALACARAACGSLFLDISDLGDIKLPSPQILPAKICALELLSENVMKISLRLPPGRDFMFMEGQYVDVIGQNGISRSYSLARHCDGTTLELHVSRVVDGQMSSYWFENAKVNDLLRINGPRGTFVLRHGPETNIVYLATGTGIAPIKAMLERINRMPNELKPRSVQLFWGTRHEHEIYWDPREALSDLEVTPVLSRASVNWKGERGYVQDVMAKNLKSFKNIQVYACGSDSMIRSARGQHEALGLDSSMFFSDAFVVSG